MLAPGDIPVLRIDRGGQVTYHGPGQLVVYPLIDLRRAGLGVRDLVTALESERHRLCGASLASTAHCRRDAPGVYVEERKLASVGMRIRRGASYHGLALNVEHGSGSLSRASIPAAIAGLQMTQLAELGGPAAGGNGGGGLSHRICGAPYLPSVKSFAAHLTSPICAAARARLPRMVFDYIDGGADDERTLRANVQRFADYDAQLGRAA